MVGTRRDRCTVPSAPEAHMPTPLSIPVTLAIRLDGEIIDLNSDVRVWGSLPMVRDGRREWYLAESSEAAGEKAREYWADMAANDPKEFVCMVGEQTLIQWGMGHRAGPGTTQVKSLNEWLDLHLNTPEEHFASYDSSEIDVMIPEGFDVDQDYTAQESVREAQVRIDAANASELDDVAPEPDDLLLVGFAQLCEELGFVPAVAYRHN